MSGQRDRPPLADDPRLVGKLIVVEGPDGVGKSTVAQGLAGRLTAQGVRSEYMTFPGQRRGTIGQIVYEIHHDPGRFGIDQLSPTSLQALHIAAHLDAIERDIIPLLRDGTWIILDRFWWSTWVYGRVAGVERAVLDAMIGIEKLQWRETYPELLVLVDRSFGVTSQGRDELRREYRALYGSERNQYPVRKIQNDASVADAIEDILSILEGL